MSIWTHVAAIARIDILPYDINNPIELFGKQCLFDDPSETWYDKAYNPDDYLPSGREGTLHIEVWKNPEENHANKWTVSIFGDLRDYSSDEDIIEWFKDKISQCVMMRQATIAVETEYYGKWNWTYDGEELDEEEDA